MIVMIQPIFFTTRDVTVLMLNTESHPTLAPAEQYTVLEMFLLCTVGLSKYKHTTTSTNNIT